MPRKVAPWMAEAFELNLTPGRVCSKMRTLRSSKAKKYGVTIAEMEVIFGFNLDEMASSLLYAIRSERCRGPRCGRVKFREFVTNDAQLELITCDIINPELEPFWCMNVRWVCSQDNKGDRDSSMAARAARLVVERTMVVAPPNEASPNVGHIQGTLW